MKLSRKTLRLGAIGLGAGFQFFATIYMARVTGIDGFGEYILQLAAMQFLVSFSVGGGLLFWFRERAKIEQGTLGHRQLATVSYGLALLFAPVGAALFAWGSEAAAMGPETLIYLPLYLIVHLAHLAYAESRFTRPAMESTSIFVWFVGRQSMLIFLVFLYNTNRWSFPLVLLNMISYSVMLPFMAFLPRMLNADWRAARGSLREWWIVNTTTVSSQLFSTLDVYAVRFIAGEATVGIYSYVSRLLRPQLLLHKTLSQYYNRPLAQRVADGEFALGYRFLRRIGLYSGSGAALSGLAVIAYLLMFDSEIEVLVAEGLAYGAIVIFVVTMYLTNTLNCSFGPNGMYMVMAYMSHRSTAINLLGFGLFMALMAVFGQILTVPQLAAPASLFATWTTVNLLREWSLRRHARLH